jgi:hypothetical protein
LIFKLKEVNTLLEVHSVQSAVSIGHDELLLVKSANAQGSAALWLGVKCSCRSLTDVEINFSLLSPTTCVRFLPGSKFEGFLDDPINNFQQFAIPSACVYRIAFDHQRLRSQNVSFQEQLGIPQFGVHSQWAFQRRRRTKAEKCAVYPLNI